jgi:hypothetical protein
VKPLIVIEGAASADQSSVLVEVSLLCAVGLTAPAKLLKHYNDGH